MKSTRNLAVCRSWIGGGTPVPDPDTRQPSPQDGDAK